MSRDTFRRQPDWTGRAIMTRVENACSESKRIDLIYDHADAIRQRVLEAFADGKSVRDLGGFTKLALEQLGPMPEPKPNGLGMPTNPDYWLWFALKQNLQNIINRAKLLILESETAQ